MLSISGKEIKPSGSIRLSQAFRISFLEVRKVLTNTFYVQKLPPAAPEG